MIEQIPEVKSHVDTEMHKLRNGAFRKQKHARASYIKLLKFIKARYSNERMENLEQAPELMSHE